MSLHIDIETFSEVDLTSAGVYRYAENESTSLNCGGWAVDDGPVNLWVPFEWSLELQSIIKAVAERHPAANIHVGTEVPSELMDAWRGDPNFQQGDSEKRAHNAQFERVVLNGRAGEKLGFPKTTIAGWACTACKAAASGIPRSMADGAAALGTHPKDEGGRPMMLQLSKPRKPTKADPSTRWTFQNAPDKWIAMLCYNIDDVLAERDLDNALPDLIESEQRMYEIDQLINETGWAVDLEAVNNILFVVEQYKEKLAAEFAELTADWMGDGLKPSQREKVGEWVRANGFPGLVDLTADYVRKVSLRTDIPANVKRALSIYSTYNAKSVSKLQAMLDAVCADGRLRGMFIFYGAATGRWSSSIVQLQNMMRPLIKDPNAAIEAFAERDIEWIRFLWPDIDPMKVAGSCIRGCLVATTGCDLIFPDYSGIEDRVNAWFFDEEWVLEAYRKYDKIIPGKFDKKGEPLREGRHLYSQTVCRAFGIDINTFSDEDPRRQQGKVMRLAMGYEGGVSAFVTMAETYQVNLNELATTVLPLLPEDALSHAEWMHANHPCAEVRSGEISVDVETACNGLKFLYRQNHPRIKQGWKDMKEAAEKAVEFKGTVFWIPNKRIGFRVETYKGRDWLCMRLPSGRKIKYFKPRWIPPKIAERWINNELVEYTVPGEFRYFGQETYTRQWGELSTYGGKLTENADQGYSSDILRGALVRGVAAGHRICGHEHDKAIFEIPKGTVSVNELKEIMLQDVPPGLPMTVDGKFTSRYGK